MSEGNRNMKEGFIVKVKRKHTDKENKTCIPWMSQMDKTIGMKGRVVDNLINGAVVVYFPDVLQVYVYSKNVLEILED